MALFPKRVDLNQASIATLVGLFNDSAKDLQGYLLTLDGATVSKSSIIQVKLLIRQRLEKLGVSVGNWISTAVPMMYVQGMHDAAKQQQSFGQDALAATILGFISRTAPATGADTPPEITVGEPKLISPKQETVDLHTQSVQTIMDNMSSNFGDSLTGMARSADKVVSSIQSLDIRRQIAQGASDNADTSKISKQISDTIKEGGISALVDSSGRQWSPDVYASMLTRTQLTTARNNGMMNAQQSVGQDLVEVSSHGATDVCADWEGEILSISGNDPGYSSVDDATADGLFHPNCQHSLNAVDSKDYPSTESDTSQLVGASVGADDDSEE
jgi:hypothetical protein